MRNIIATLVLLIGCTTFSQGLTLGDTSPKPIELKNGRIYQNNEQIPSYQVKKLLASNLHSLNLYKQAKTKEALGGMLFGLGSAACVADLAVGVFSNAKYPTVVTYASVAVVAISIPILSGRAKKVEEAVKTYNDGLKNTSSSATGYDLTAVANQNGIGIKIKF